MHFGRYIKIEFYNEVGLLARFDNEVELNFISMKAVNGKEEHVLKMYNLSKDMRKILTSREDDIKIKIFASYKEISPDYKDSPYEIFSGEKLAYRDEYWNHPVHRSQNNSIISEIRMISDGYKMLNIDIQDNIKDSVKTIDVIKRIGDKAGIFFNYDFSEDFVKKLKTYKKGKNTNGVIASILMAMIIQNNYSFFYFHYNQGISLIERFKDENDISKVFEKLNGITLDYERGDIIGNPREQRLRKKYNKDLGIVEYAKPSIILSVPITRFNDFIFPGRPVKVLYLGTVSYYMIYGIRYNISNRDNDFFNIELDLRVDFAENIYRDDDDNS